MLLTEQILKDIPLAVVDTETTGASASFGDRVCEVGVIRVEGGRQIDAFESLVNPGRPISPGASAITGITDAMVSDAPGFSSLLPGLLPMFRGAVVVGHNIPFDLCFLHGEFRRCGQALGAVLLAPVALDTLRIARRRFGRGGNSLSALASRLGIVPSAAHRAMADAQTTFAVLCELLAPVGGFDVPWNQALEQQGGPVDVLAADRPSIMPLELEEALAHQGQVEMDYVGESGELTRRVVRPLRVRRQEGQYVLVAFCCMRLAQRTFRMDRIVRLSRVDPETQIPVEDTAFNP